MVTDRNVYLCRLSSMRSYGIAEVLEKRLLGEARLQFQRNRVTLDGANAVYVGYLPIGKRWARQVIAAADGTAPVRT